MLSILSAMQDNTVADRLLLGKQLVQPANSINNRQQLRPTECFIYITHVDVYNVCDVYVKIVCTYPETSPFVQYKL